MAEAAWIHPASNQTIYLHRIASGILRRYPLARLPSRYSGATSKTILFLLGIKAASPVNHAANSSSPSPY